MLLRHSLSLTLSNMNLVFKVLLYALVILFVGSALVVTIATPILDAIGTTINVEDYINHFVEDILRGDGAVFDRIVNAVDNFATTHPNDVGKVIGLGVAVIFVMKLLLALIVCPVAYIIDGRMATNFTPKFFHSIVELGWKSVLLSLVYTLISFPIDILIVGGAFFLGRWLVTGIGLFGMILALAIGLVLLTLRMCAMGQLIPTLCNEKLKFDILFKRGMRLSFKLTPKLFPAMLTLNLLSFGIILTTLVPTFMVIPIVMVPVILVCFCAIHLTAYYNYNSKHYYIDDIVK